MDIIDDHPTRLPTPWTIDINGQQITTEGARHACRLLSGVADLDYVDGRFGSRTWRRTLRFASWAKTEDEAWLWMAYEELRLQENFYSASVGVGEAVEAEHRAWYHEMAKAEDERLSRR